MEGAQTSLAMHDDVWVAGSISAGSISAGSCVLGGG
jgi:hypothetical protein